MSLTAKFLEDDIKQIFDLFDENSKIFLRGNPPLICIRRGKAGVPAVKKVLESGVMGESDHMVRGSLEMIE